MSFINRLWTRRNDAGAASELIALGGMKRGEVVRHKVSGVRAVILDFNDDGISVSVSVGFQRRDEFECNVWEIEPATTGAQGRINGDAA